MLIFDLEVGYEHISQDFAEKMVGTAPIKNIVHWSTFFNLISLSVVVQRKDIRNSLHICLFSWYRVVLLFNFHSLGYRERQRIAINTANDKTSWKWCCRYSRARCRDLGESTVGTPQNTALHGVVMAQVQLPAFTITGPMSREKYVYRLHADVTPNTAAAAPLSFKPSLSYSPVVSSSPCWFLLQSPFQDVSSAFRIFQVNAIRYASTRSSKEILRQWLLYF